MRARGVAFLAAGTPPGVHALRLEGNGSAREMPLIVAPRRLPGLSSGRQWGLFVPVYALRDRATWGCGDLRSLEAVGRWAAEHGATVLATLPLLPAFLDHPYEPSPYRPVSRRFWNEVYLDPTRTPEFRRSSRLQRLVRSPSFRRRVAALERRDHVDFRAVARLKRNVLERMLAEFRRAPPRRRAAFRRYLERTDGIREYARFRGSLERDPDRGARYHQFVQWLTDEQLRGVARRLRRRGLGLALDLPLGTHPQGFDARRDAPLYVRGIGIGSPPDPGVPEGQAWGFAPWDPQALRRVGYRPLADAIRHECAVASVLRIDHVLGLHRLFWIPVGEPPRNGAYVRYPVHELYAVILAEAAQTGTTIVGEDLGTVPPDVRPELRRHGLLGVYVAELEWDGPGAPRPIPQASVVSMNTHDHLPFAGYWSDRANRPPATGGTRGFPPPSTATGDAFRRATLRLARSRAALLLVNLEDLGGETRPQNVPGTVGTNFSRRCRVSLEALRRDARAAELLCTIDAVRRARHAR
jgi:4-alpha-glucanotransferase